MSDVVERSALAELESRAGASDEFRPAWLAERRGGVTATEIRDLYLRKITKEKLIGQKLGRIPDTGDLASYAKVPAWGKQREPEIAAEVLARYAMSPESRVFHAADDPRKLASPDGTGENFDGDLQIAEIKTHGQDQDVAPGGKEYVKKGYYPQMVWQMRVTAARRCLYATEERLPDGTWYRSGEQRFYWIDWDDEARALATELEVIADDFLAALDAAAAEDYVAPEVDDELDTLAVNLLRFREAESEGKRAKEKAWAGLLARLAEGGVDVSQESSLARVTYTVAVSSPSEVPDVDAAKAADPVLFAEVQALSKRWNEHAAKFKKTVTVPGKPSLTVTSVKTKETKA